MGMCDYCNQELGYYEDTKFLNCTIVGSDGCRICMSCTDCDMSNKLTVEVDQRFERYGKYVHYFGIPQEVDYMVGKFMYENSGHVRVEDTSKLGKNKCVMLYYSIDTLS